MVGATFILDVGDAGLHTGGHIEVIFAARHGDTDMSSAARPRPITKSDLHHQISSKGGSRTDLRGHQKATGGLGTHAPQRCVAGFPRIHSHSLAAHWPDPSHRPPNEEHCAPSKGGSAQAALPTPLIYEAYSCCPGHHQSSFDSFQAALWQ